MSERYAARIFLQTWNFFSLMIQQVIPSCDASHLDFLEIVVVCFAGITSPAFESWLQNVSPQLVLSGNMLGGWNLPRWVCLYHRNQQRLQVRATHHPRWLLNVCLHKQEVILTLDIPSASVMDWLACREESPFNNGFIRCYMSRQT